MTGLAESIILAPESTLEIPYAAPGRFVSDDYWYSMHSCNVPCAQTSNKFCCVALSDRPSPLGLDVWRLAISTHWLDIDQLVKALIQNLERNPETRQGVASMELQRSTHCLTKEVTRAPRGHEQMATGSCCKHMIWVSGTGVDSSGRSTGLEVELLRVPYAGEEDVSPDPPGSNLRTLSVPGVPLDRVSLVEFCDEWGVLALAVSPELGEDGPQRIYLFDY